MKQLIPYALTSLTGATPEDGNAYKHAGDIILLFCVLHEWIRTPSVLMGDRNRSVYLSSTMSEGRQRIYDVIDGVWGHGRQIHRWYPQFR